MAGASVILTAGDDGAGNTGYISADFATYASLPPFGSLSSNPLNAPIIAAIETVPYFGSGFGAGVLWLEGDTTSNDDVLKIVVDGTDWVVASYGYDGTYTMYQSSTLVPLFVDGSSYSLVVTAPARRLLEDGSSFRLLEDGTSKRLLESEGDTEVMRTSGASWTLPADIDVTKPLTVITIAPGGGGAHGKSGVGSGGGGGGGAQGKAQLDISALTPGSSPIYTSFGSPGAGGAANGNDGSDGGDVWINLAANAAPTSTANGLLVKGGRGGVSTVAGGTGVNVTYKVAQSADDAVETDAPYFAIDGATLAYGYDGSWMWAGFRFSGVAVAQGATIQSASLTLYSSSGWPSGDGTWYGDKQSNAPVWSSSDKPSGITKTTASVAALGNETGMAPVTVNATAIVQELVNQAGWTSGNAMRFAIDPTSAIHFGGCYAYDYHDPSAYPTLSITYAGDAPGRGGLGADRSACVATWRWSGFAGGPGAVSAAGGKGGAAGRYGFDGLAGDGGAGGSASSGNGSDGADYGAGGGGGAETGSGGDGAPGAIILRYFTVATGQPFYRGPAGWGTFYKGVRSDSQVYLGPGTLHA